MKNAGKSGTGAYRSYHKTRATYRVRRRRCGVVDKPLTLLTRDRKFDSRLTSLSDETLSRGPFSI